MNAFQILDKDGKAIPINALDREVCEMIGVEPDPKWYCTLGRREDFPEGQKGELDFLFKTSNWYDTIGWLIASKGLSFEGIIEHYTKPMVEFIGKKDENGVEITIDYIYPYHMKVLREWIRKEYQPKQILESAY